MTKVRTFRDDFARAQMKSGGGGEIKAGEPVVKPDVATTTPQPEPKPVTKMPVSHELRHANQPIEMTAAKVATPVVTPKAEAPAKPNEKLKVDLSGVKKEGKTSLMDSGGKHLNVMEAESESGEGSIITDQKRKRFKLLPAMAEAFKGWIGDTTETVAEIAHPKYEGPRLKPAEERKGILMQAAKSSAQAPRDDYKTVAERVAKTGRKPKTSESAINIKKRSEVPPPSWTHVKGENESAIETTKPEVEAKVTTEEPTATPKEVETAKPAVEVSQKPTPAPSLPAEPTPAPVAPVEPEPVAETAPPPTTPPVAEPKVETPPEPLPPTPPPVQVPTQAPKPVERTVSPAPQAAPARAPEIRPYQAPSATRSGDRMVFSPWRVGTVAVAAILLGVSVSVWLFGGGSDGQIIANNQQTTELIRAEEQIAVPLGNSAGDLLRNLQSVQPKPTTVVAQIYPVSNVAGNTNPSSAAEIMNTLNPQAPGSFVRSVTDINFGLYRDQEPFIVMKITSFDTAFGGMLEWEGVMSADLSPFFGAPVGGTFDPQARTATQIREPYFIDTVVGNLDARLLTDETQKERLIYSFINRNTVLVTTTKDALRALANVVR